MAQSIRGENAELHTVDEAPASFDILFRSLVPGTVDNLLVNLHIDFEFQNDYSPGYPIIKRGIYYGSRKISAQLDKIGKNGEGYGKLEKVYSIWICLKNIPKDLHNTVSYYRICNYKNEGFLNPDIRIDEDKADLMEIVIVRLGHEIEDQLGLWDFLYGLLSGKKEKVLSYISGSAEASDHEEVSEMLSLISYAEEEGVKKGVQEGIKERDRLSKLMNLLLKNKCYADAEKASEDEVYREQLYRKYDL